MATDLAIAEPSKESELEDEEQWLYGDENSKTQTEDNETRPPMSSGEEQSAVDNRSSVEEKNSPEQAPKSAEDEDDEDSDSDEDDVKVTIGNIKTGASSYMGSGMNLIIKPVWGYGVAATNKLQTKGVDVETLGSFNGLHAAEAESDLYEDKPWRKPGADLSDYFNYGFNEETWKSYCEKQRRLQLGLDPCLPPTFENKITVQQGRTANLEKDTETPVVKLDYKSDFSTHVVTTPSRLKAGPPPNRLSYNAPPSFVIPASPHFSSRKMGGTIDVIGGQTGTIRRVEGRRREMQEQNPIQVLGDHGNKTQPLAPPTVPPPLPIAAPPPPHFLHRPPPVSTMPPPPIQPPGLPPPSLPGLFPPPLAPPPNLMMPPVTSRCPTSGYTNRAAAPPPFGYSSGEHNFISYPPVSSSHMQWGPVMDKGMGGGGGGARAGHWDHHVSRRERGPDREREERGEQPLNTSEYNEEERYRYYPHEGEDVRDYERNFHHSHDAGRGREEHSGRDRRHRAKEESSKHKSSKRKQHDDDGEGHRRHKHKKSKRSKEDRSGGEEVQVDEHEHKD